MKIFTKTYMKLLALYSSQYIPLGFFFGAIPAILGSNGVSMEVIGSIYMLGLFWVLKFLWAPFIDRFTLFSSKSHYKSWLYLIQSLLSLSVFICAFFSITESFVISICLIAFINFFSSLQDICVDGLVLNNINRDELEYANAIQTSGTFIGAMIGLALPLISYELYTWKVTLIILSILTILPVFILYSIDEGKKEVISDRFKYLKGFSLLKQKSIYSLFFIMIPAYWIVEGTFGLIQQLLLKYEWSLIDIVISQNFIGSIFGILGALLVGTAISKIGKAKSYRIISVLIFIDILLMINYKSFFDDHILVTILLSYNYFCLGLFMTIYYTYIMSNSSKEYAGTQVNLQHSILLFVSLIYSKLIFNLASAQGFSSAFKILAVVFLASSIYSYFFFKDESYAKQ